MFVIERGIDEAICVGDTVVRVLEVRSGSVRLAISSPDGPRYREVTLQCHSLEDVGFSSEDASHESLLFQA